MITTPKLKTCASALIIGCAALLAGGCASIVHGGSRKITINTQPEGAKATITTADGATVSVTNTPCTVALDPKRGYFKGQAYRLQLELAGYHPVSVELRPEMSGWYWGNILFGGLIGMVVVDPLTGSMWNIAPEKIEQKLAASQASLIRSGSGFVVVMASDLTPGEKAAMVRIH